MATVSDDEVLRRCHDLVYQVAYAFYDTPYILLLKLLLAYSVIRESELAEIVHLASPNEVRKYLGMLHVHRLIKRHVNKEKQPIPDHMLKRDDVERFRSREIAYWYIDFREFANVVKYRIAMMRKAVDEKLSSEVGHRGYVCPNDGTTYAALDLSHLFDPMTNSFACELCHAELVEQSADDIPDANGGGANGNGGDRMQRFNTATSPIRDALRAVEGLTLPSLNIMAWIALNVKTQIVDAHGEGEGGEGEKKITVVIGGEEEREIIERERLAEQQRTQNALPVWHTHSTVTGAATSLGLPSGSGGGGGGHARKPSLDQKDRFGLEGEDEEDALLAHYAQLDEPERPIKSDPDFGGAASASASASAGPSSRVSVSASTTASPRIPDDFKVPSVTPAEEQDDDEEEEEDEDDAPPAGVQARPASGAVVMVAGLAKAVEDVTEEDQELMTPDEYQAYYEAALA